MNPNEPRHNHGHAFQFFNAREREGLVFAGRRGMLKAGLAGFAGLTLPNLLRARADAADGHAPDGNRGAKNGKSVILLWMAGGPSHIDTWDLKPDRPLRQSRPLLGHPDPVARRPHLRALAEAGGAARQASRSSARSTPRHSNHEPNMVFQTGNLEAAPRVNPQRPINTRPSAPVIAKHRGPNHPGHAALCRLHDGRVRTSPSPATWARQYDPFIANRRRGCRSTPTSATTPAG